ncbi:hypothetical protein J8273_0568 [Carpediemonas membranifera]|uniref:RGS domain-containing protein n=1 Tax=Carpediemonas membranifera TaxID=201153 RepID=A0A8J6B6K6_9EUKA|nr:hypothetical protein J8273_0568 [Carpediemonas membranifera]|eukprot:KAG9395329.1 hypothetical protein J8273_0568 [Carpediemonas membranifera]
MLFDFRLYIEYFADYGYIAADIICVALFFIFCPFIIVRRIRSPMMTVHVLCSSFYVFTAISDIIDRIQGDYIWPEQYPFTIFYYLSFVGTNMSVFAPFCVLPFLIISVFLSRRGWHLKGLDKFLPVIVVAIVAIAILISALILFVSPSSGFFGPLERRDYESIMMDRSFQTVSRFGRISVILAWGLLLMVTYLGNYPVLNTQMLHMFIAVLRLITLFAWPFSTDLATGEVDIHYIGFVFRLFISSTAPVANVVLLVTVPILVFPSTVGEILTTTTGCRALFEFLKLEYSEENLTFLFAIRHAIIAAGFDTFYTLKFLREVNATYLSEQSDQCVNLPSEISNPIRIAIDKATQPDVTPEFVEALFTPAIADVRAMLDGSCQRFVNTDQYAAFLRHLQIVEDLPQDHSVLGMILQWITQRDRTLITPLVLKQLPDEYAWMVKNSGSVGMF